MPRFNPNLRIADCHGSIGSISFYHVDGICHWRTKPQPQFPGTEQQLQQLTVHRRAIASWRGLPAVTQAQWNHIAKTATSHRPPFDSLSHISGYNLFVSAYHGFTQLGSEHIPQPTPLPIFPKVAIEITRASLISQDDLQLHYTIRTLDGGLIPDTFRPIARIQLAPPYAGRNQSLMRTVLSDQEGHTFTLKDYKNTWPVLQDLRPVNQIQDTQNQDSKGPSETVMRLFMHYALIDASTGYRGGQARFSTFIQLS